MQTSVFHWAFSKTWSVAPPINSVFCFETTLPILLAENTVSTYSASGQTFAEISLPSYHLMEGFFV